MTTRCSGGQLRQPLDQRDADVAAEDRPGGQDRPSSSAAASDDVVVLPFVPVTPIVGQGHSRRTRSVSLTSAGDPTGSARCASTTARRAARSRGSAVGKSGLMLGEVAIRSAADHVDAGSTSGPSRSSTARPPSDSMAEASSPGRPSVVDGDPGAGIGEEPGQGDAASGQPQHRHRPAAEGAFADAGRRQAIEIDDTPPHGRTTSGSRRRRASPRACRPARRRSRSAS